MRVARVRGERKLSARALLFPSLALGARGSMGRARHDGIITRRRRRTGDGAAERRCVELGTVLKGILDKVAGRGAAVQRR